MLPSFTLGVYDLSLKSKCKETSDEKSMTFDLKSEQVEIKSPNHDFNLRILTILEC